MKLEIEPSLTVAQFSQVVAGVLVQMMDGSRAITAVITARQPPDKVLVIYAKSESKFTYDVIDGDPTVIAFEGVLILRPDAGSAFEGRPSGNSNNELYFEGNNPLVYVHGTATTKLLNLSTGAIESSHGGQMIGFKKWSICVRQNGELFTLMAFEPSAAATFAKLGQ
jgi:hypothetical protein